MYLWNGRIEELRVDEFSVQKLRESHDTIRKLTSQTQESQERVNLMNDSREFQNVESIYSGHFSYVPSQLAVHYLCRAVTTGACHSIHGICLKHKERFCQSTSCVRFNTDTLSRNSSLWATCREKWRINWEHIPNADICRKAVDHELILSYQRKFHKIPWLYSKDFKYRSFSSIRSPHFQRFHVGR